MSSSREPSEIGDIVCTGRRQRDRDPRSHLGSMRHSQSVADAPTSCQTSPSVTGPSRPNHEGSETSALSPFGARDPGFRFPAARLRAAVPTALPTAAEAVADSCLGQRRPWALWPSNSAPVRRRTLCIVRALQRYCVSSASELWIGIGELMRQRGAGRSGRCSRARLAGAVGVRQAGGVVAMAMRIKAVLSAVRSPVSGLAVRRPWAVRGQLEHARLSGANPGHGHWTDVFFNTGFWCVWCRVLSATCAAPGRAGITASDTR